MARINWGITNGFVGKLGNVVGFNWKGINLQRAKTRVSNPRTKKQMLQRAKFAVSGKLASSLYDALYYGYRSEARELRSTQNGLFLKENKEAITGTLDGILINFEALKLSKKSIKGVAFGQMSKDGNVLTVAVTNEYLIGHRCGEKDRIYVCLLCPEKEESICQAVGVRTDTSVTVNIPASWGSRKVYVYGYVIGAQLDNADEASETTFIGSFGEGEVTSAYESAPAGNGGGSETPAAGGAETPAATLAAPVISGETPFTETTQVTITGPDGAEIHYTTSGSNPTSTSNLYSEPLTLSATTTVKAIAIKDGVSSAVTTKIFSLSGDGEYDPNEGDMG